eukprot:1696944-Alexandrium_andersonii.AAC.1
MGVNGPALPGSQALGAPTTSDSQPGALGHDALLALYDDALRAEAAQEAADQQEAAAAAAAWSEAFDPLAMESYLDGDVPSTPSSPGALE